LEWLIDEMNRPERKVYHVPLPHILKILSNIPHLDIKEPKDVWKDVIFSERVNFYSKN